MNASEEYVLEIIPGILEKEWSAIEQKLQIVKSFAKTVHIDLIDGKFAQNSTFMDPKPFTPFAKEMTLELHMMVENPQQYLKLFADAGFTRFLGHVEKMSDQVAFVAEAQLYGEVGLVIDGPTEISAIQVPYEDLDVLFCMTIKAGQSGQAFEDKHLEKVREIRKKLDEKSLLRVIEVDGGINYKTIVKAKEAGVIRFVTTSFLFNSENPEVQYKNLQKLIGVL